MDIPAFKFTIIPMAYQKPSFLFDQGRGLKKMFRRLFPTEHSLKQFNEFKSL